MPKRYLVLHLNSNGDLLFATAITKQLKEVDDPGCHITWAVAKPFKSVLLNNPHINHIWEIDAENYLDIKTRVFRKVEDEVKTRMAKGEWDQVICPQLMFENMWRYDGTIRRAILKSYPGTINDVTPVLRLTEEEQKNVAAFVLKINLKKYKVVVLFECSPQSGQSLVTPEFAFNIATEILERNPDTAFILTSNKKIHSSIANIIDGSELSFRENAELTNYCTHLIGCSSGITWLSLSDWSKQLVMLQLNSTGINPVRRDFQREGIDDSNLVEMHRFNVKSVVQCFTLIMNGEIAAAKEKFNQEVPPEVSFIEGILLYLLNNKYYKKASEFIYRNIVQSSFHPALLLMILKLPLSAIGKFVKRKRSSLFTKTILFFMFIIAIGTCF
jgi:hypothetical protein